MTLINYILDMWQNPYVKKTVKGSAAVFSMALLTGLIGYVIRIVLSRQLSLEDFGLFYAVFTFVIFFDMFKNLGLNHALMKFIPEFKVKKKYGEIRSIIKYVLFTNLTAAIVISAIWLIFSNYLAANYFNNVISTELLFILSIYFVISVFLDTLAYSCLGFQRNLFFSLRLFLINVFVLAGIVLSKNLGVISPALSYAGAVILTGIVFVFLFKKSFKIPKRKSKFSSKLYKQLFKFGIPLTLTIAGSTIIGYIDVLMLTFFRNLEEVGVYSAVLPSAIFFSVIGRAIGTVLIPVVSEMWAKKKYKEVNRGVKLINYYLSLLLAPLVIIFFIFSKQIITILFGEQFAIGHIAFRILIIGAAFHSLFSINGNSITARGKPQTVTKIVLFLAVVNIIVNLLLIPKYGMVGAAIATSLSYFLGFLLIIRKSRSPK